MTSKLRTLAAVMVEAAAGAALAAAVVGCATGRTGPKLPSFEDARAQVDTFAQKTDRARNVIKRDLNRLQELEGELRHPPEGLLAEPFPLDLFRHVLMACLNARTSTQVARNTETTSDGLQCDPHFADKLETALQETVPQRHETAMSLLGKADAFQRLRGRLRRRLTKVPQLVRTNRDTLASRRAELANRSESLKDQKTEYSTSRWREVSSRIDAYRNALNKLEHATNQLDTSDEVWPERLESINHDLYMAIARHWVRPENGE
jgi:hypothetical protein